MKSLESPPTLRLCLALTLLGWVGFNAESVQAAGTSLLPPTPFGDDILAPTATVCTAAEICGSADPCVISATWQIGTGCTLDFGTRDVVVKSSGDLQFGSGSIAIAAASLTLESGSFLDGRGTGVNGGSIDIALLDAFTSYGKIDVSSDANSGGSISIVASGHGFLSGSYLYAHGRTTDSDGGSIDLNVQGDLAMGTTLYVYGGSYSGGGTATLTAGGRLDITKAIDAHGGEFDGGEIVATSGGIMTVSAVTFDTNGGGEGGYGGAIDLAAGKDLSCSATLKASGGGTTEWSADGGEILLSSGAALTTGTNTFSANGDGGGGYGGDIELYGRSVQVGGILYAYGTGSAEYGGDGGAIDVTAIDDVKIIGKINAYGDGPDSVGGDLTIDAGGLVSIAAALRADASGTDSGGGTITIAAGKTVALDSTLAADGKGWGGGWIDISGAGGVSIDAGITANGTGGYGDGGYITVESSVGQVRVDASVAANGDVEGAGGEIALTACDVLMTTVGYLRTDSTNGLNRLTARETMTLEGAAKLSSGGSNVLVYRVNPPVISGSASINPAAQKIQDSTLTACHCQDADADGRCDENDNCPGAANPDQSDADADGRGDVCDSCPQDPGNDVDGDGLCAGADPCPDDPANDADGDGLCADVDPCPDDSSNDPDQDGVCDGVDNCPLDSNSSQTDADADGLGDLCDCAPDDPSQPGSDGACASGCGAGAGVRPFLPSASILFLLPLFRMRRRRP